jgi:hypothetical protein
MSSVTIESRTSVAVTRSSVRIGSAQYFVTSTVPVPTNPFT